MKDITSAGWIKFKGILFLIVGLCSSALLLWEYPKIKVALLLAITVWCFCRFYYFAFYVIEHYVDPGYRFSGLWSFARYLLSRRERQNDAMNVVLSVWNDSDELVVNRARKRIAVMRGLRWFMLAYGLCFLTVAIYPTVRAITRTPKIAIRRKWLARGMADVSSGV